MSERLEETINSSNWSEFRQEVFELMIEYSHKTPAKAYYPIMLELDKSYTNAVIIQTEYLKHENKILGGLGR